MHTRQERGRHVLFHLGRHMRMHCGLSLMERDITDHPNHFVLSDL
jgi:hypothetical protein